MIIPIINCEALALTNPDHSFYIPEQWKEPLKSKYSSFKPFQINWIDFLVLAICPLKA